MSKTSNYRIKALFYKKLICSHCGSNMKKKKERQIVKYCCSKYDNFGTCKRVMIEEDYLVELIHKRFNEDVTRELIENYIDSILVEDRNLVEIFIKDQDSILMSKTHLRF